MQFDQLLVMFAAGSVGLVIGSFLNALIYRVHEGISIIRGKNGEAARSFCPHCKHLLSAKDLIPVISYLMLRGYCRYCHKPIHWQYPVVELASALLCVAAAWRFGVHIDTPIVALYFVVLLFIFLYDLKYQLILDSVMLPLLPVVFALSLVRGYAWQDLLLGGLVGGGFFALQYIVSHGKWIGGGDIRLGVLLGFILGFRVTIVALFVAYLAGACVATYLLIRKRADLQSRVAFGTFLSVAGVACVLWGTSMLEWYLGLLL